MNSRAKGKRGELELAAWLRNHGYPEARRGVQYNGADGSADVIGMPGYHIEVKRVEKTAIEDWLKQAEKDSRENEIPIVFHRRNGEEWKITLRAEDFIKKMPYEGIWCEREDNDYECYNCGYPINAEDVPYVFFKDELYTFCPYCGAHNRRD